MDEHMFDLEWSRAKGEKALRGRVLHSYPDGDEFEARFVGKDLVKVFEDGEFKAQYRQADFAEVYSVISTQKWSDNADASDCSEELIEEISLLQDDFSKYSNELKYIIPIAIRIRSFSMGDSSKEDEAKAFLPKDTTKSDPDSEKQKKLSLIKEACKNPVRGLFATQRFLDEAFDAFEKGDWDLFRTQCASLSSFSRDNLAGFLKGKKGHYLVRYSDFKLQEYYFDGHGNRVIHIRGRDFPAESTDIKGDDVVFVSFVPGSDHDKMNRKLESMSMSVFDGIIRLA